MAVSFENRIPAPLGSDPAGRSRPRAAAAIPAASSVPPSAAAETTWWKSAQAAEKPERPSSVGPAVALCSWTSIVGYGSLLGSLNRALRSFGWYAMVGEVTTIVTALVLLPALLVVASRAGSKSVNPTR